MDEKTKAKLKELLGDKYDEFIALLGDTPLWLSEGKIPLDRFNEVNTKLKTAESEVSRLTAENTTLKATNDTLTGTINTTTAVQKLEEVLTKAGAKNLKVVKTLLEVDEKTPLEEVQRKVDALKASDPYLFNGNTASGNTPNTSNTGDTSTITQEDFDKMTYKEKVALFNKDKATYDRLAKG